MRILLLLLVLLAAPATAQVEVSFGPTPRALDNRNFLDTSVALRRAEWRAAAGAGLRVIDVNPTFLLQVELGRAREGGALLARYPGTYLDDAALADLRARVDEGFRLNYQAGIGLSADRCEIASPEALGRAAAEAEYKATVARLHDAGIAVAEVSVDGPFLRLLRGSEKAFSCASGTRNAEGVLLSDGGEGKSIAVTARAVAAYLARLSDLIGARQSRAPALALTLNLPNWPEAGYPAVAWEDMRTTISEMLRVYAAEAAGNGPQIRWIRLDYPACYATGAQRCGGQGPQVFAAKVAGMWQAARLLNGTGTPPRLAVIVNDTGGVAPCVAPNATPKFLPFANFRDQSIGRSAPDPGRAGFSVPDANCQRAQRDGPDRQFMRNSVAYARNVTQGALARQLRRADPDLVVSRLAFQSWGVSPMSNLWYLSEVRKFIESR